MPSSLVHTPRLGFERRPESERPDQCANALLRKALLGRCLRWTRGNLHEAEDLLGDAWLQLLKSIGRGGAQPLNRKGFLLTVIDNLGRDRLRHARRWKRGDSDDCDSLQALTSSSEHLVFLRECLAEAARCLSYVGEKQRSALLLRSGGQEYAEIAMLLATSESNARKLVETARGRLSSSIDLRSRRRTAAAPTRKEPEEKGFRGGRDSWQYCEALAEVR
jgi:RNA polymerase sigma factor (sigma-70 family)